MLLYATTYIKRHGAIAFEVHLVHYSVLLIYKIFSGNHL